MEFNLRQKKVIEADDNKILCLAAAGSGKALPNFVSIPTTRGWKKVSKIKKGDYLYNRKGKPTKVLNVFPQGEKDVYELTLGDGRKAKCSKDHLWNVYKDKNSNEMITLTTEEIMKNIQDRKLYNEFYYLPKAEAIEHYFSSVTPDEGYLYGILLSCGKIIDDKIGIVTSNKEIVSKVVKILDVQKAYSEDNVTWFFKDKVNKEDFTIKHFMKKQKNENFMYFVTVNKLFKSKNKNSIKKYFIENCNIATRLAFVQGYLDMNGYIIHNRGVDNIICTTLSHRFAKGFVKLMGSLGYTCTYNKNDLTIKSILLRIPDEDKEKMFLLDEHKKKAFENIKNKLNRKYDRTSIVDIKKLDCQTEMTCFLVDNKEHLFLTENYIVTHNTSVLTARIEKLINEGCRPQDIISISFTNMAAEEMKKRLGKKAQGAFIGTIHSLANNICIANGIDTTKYIDEGKFDLILKKALNISNMKYPKVKHLLVDEFQDTCALDMQFLEKINTENFFVVGDERQAIYGFRGASLNYLHHLNSDINCKKYYLTTNYRCAPNIISFADDLLGSMEKISLKTEAAKTKSGVIRETSFRDAVEELEYYKDYGNWAILCRTNAEIDAAVKLLEEKEIPCITFKRSDLDLAEMESLLRENKVKVLTVHVAKGLEFKKVIAVGAKKFNEEERRIAYVAATRAEMELYWCPSISTGRKKVTKKTTKSNSSTKMVAF